MPGDSSDRDPAAAPGGAEANTPDEGNPPERGTPPSLATNLAGDPPAAVQSRPDDPATRSTEFDALAAFLPESVVRGRQAATQTADPSSRDPHGSPVAGNGERSPSPDSLVCLTDALRVTSGPRSGSGSNNWAILLLCAGVVLIGIASQFMGFGSNPRQEPPNPGSAATSAGAPAPPATGPTVEAPQQDAAPTMPPAAKAVEEKDQISPDVPRKGDGQLSRLRPAAPAPVSPASKAPEKTGSDERPAGLSLPQPPASTAAPLAIAELPTIDLQAPFRQPAPPPPAPETATIQVDHRQEIQRVLDAYAESYDRLDASSAALLWRGVDSRALARAFSGLSSQDLSFDQCDVSIDGPQATAVCRGELRYVRRVGSPGPHVLRASWTIDFERATDRWIIASVNVR